MTVVRSLRQIILAATLVAGCLLVVPGRAHAFATAFFDPAAFSGPDPGLAFRRAHDAGTNVVEIQIYWASVAPQGSTEPAGFEPADPGAQGYDWASTDQQVTDAYANGLTPVLNITASPAWAQANPAIPNDEPSPSQLAAFVTAAATRYNGDYKGLPSVRHWIIWNEPNSSRFLLPQYVNGKLASPGIYRNLLNAATVAIHRVDPRDRVVAGQLDPFSHHAADGTVAAPEGWMEALLCESPPPHSHPTCDAHTRFDLWSYHPYTYGGPDDRALDPGDISLGNLQTADRIVEAAVAAHHVISSQHIAFWVTEFAWDSDPPIPGGVPQRLLTRWVAGALYTMWRAHISLVTWFLLYDEAFPPSGMYYLGATPALDQPKPSLAAFRFPFVAYPHGSRIRIWGRTPGGEPGLVTIEQFVGGTWHNLGHIITGAGVFTTLVTGDGEGALRAVSAGGASPAFSLHSPPDRRIGPF